MVVMGIGPHMVLCLSPLLNLITREQKSVVFQIFDCICHLQFSILFECFLGLWMHVGLI